MVQMLAWDQLSDEERQRFKALEMEKWNRDVLQVLPYRAVKQAGENGDVDILTAVLTRHKEESEGIIAPSDPDLSTILGWGQTPWHRRQNQDTIEPMVFARYLVASLREAAENGHMEVCKLLWIDGPGREYYKEGAAINWPAYVDKTISSRLASAKQNPLYLAASKGHLDIFRKLLDSDNGHKNPMLQTFWKACDSRAWSRVRNARKRVSNMQVLAERRVELGKAALFMLEQGAEPSDFGMLLQEAPGEIIRGKLLEYWARKNASGRDAQGDTLLHIACNISSCPLWLMQAVLKHTTSFSALSALNATGLLPIHLACMQNLSLDIVYSLARHQPDTLAYFGSLLVQGKMAEAENPLEPPVKKLKTM